MGVPRVEEQLSLEQHFKDCDWVNDPSAIDYVLEYYERVVEEDDNFIQEVLNKLPLMEVDWLRPWYQQMESSILKFTAEDRPDHPDQYRTDRFTQEEDRLLWKNWKRFLKKYTLPNKPQSFARWRNMDKNKRKSCPFEKVRGVVTAHLGRGLQRTLRQVYRQFVNEYAYPKKGAYSPVEEQIMDICFGHFRDKSVMILSKVLGRESRGIYNRFNIFRNGKVEKRKRVKWDLDMAAKFLNSLIRHSGGSLEDLRDKPIKRDVWLKVQEDIDVPHDRLHKFWFRKLYVQCFLHSDLTTMKITRKIYKALRKSEYRRWRDIRWKEVAKRFPEGCTPLFLHCCASRFLASYCHGYLHRPLCDVLVDWREHKTKMNNRRLKLVCLNSQGNLAFREGGNVD